MVWSSLSNGPLFDLKRGVIEFKAQQWKTKREKGEISMKNETYNICVALGGSAEMAMALASEDNRAIALELCRLKGGRTAKVADRLVRIEQQAKGGAMLAAVTAMKAVIRRIKKDNILSKNEDVLFLEREVFESVMTWSRIYRKDRVLAKQTQELLGVAGAIQAAELAVFQERKAANEAADEAIVSAIVESIAEVTEAEISATAAMLRRAEAAYVADVEEAKKAAKQAARQASKEAAAIDEFVKESVMTTALAVEYDVSVEDIDNWKTIAEDKKVSFGKYLYFRGFIQEAASIYSLDARKCWEAFWKAMKYHFKDFQMTLKVFGMILKNQARNLPKAVKAAIKKVGSLTRTIIQRVNGKIRTFHYPVE